MTAAALDNTLIRRRDWLTILVVGIAHAGSHFFQLVIPSLYLPLGREFGLDFAQLGLLVSAFFVTSGLGQASSGFVVDRVGARPVLWFGLACFVLSGILLGTANGYTMLFVAAVIAGVGNSVFHPVDFSILNRRVSAPRLGHAFSAHGLTGSLGWALTPVFMITLTQLHGWRVAAFGASAVVGAVLVLTLVARKLLDGEIGEQDSAKGGAPVAPAVGPTTVAGTLAALLAKPALWGAFLFFAMGSIAFSAVQNYTIPLLGSLYALSAVAASSALSGYMVASATGILAGGFLVSTTPRTERIVAASLCLAGLMLVLLALGGVPAWLAAPAVALAGFFSGLAGPSRDMLIRRVTPRGSLGSVYGLVYSGMDVGAALGPLVFGLMLDAGWRHGPWLGAALAFAAAAGLAALIARAARAQEASSAATAVAPRPAA
ncbi:putative transmembrane transport protein [plant metagenome]|uniref:Putative transmembrane transport protein n=1 Tax=plant metagenome TaxID=1297885 RepID=A0A484RZJ6_9ZZZZ